MRIPPHAENTSNNICPLLQDGWQYRDNPNFKFIWYEDMRANIDGTIREIADFTGYKVNEDQIDRLKDHLHIDNMKKNDAVNMKPPKGTVPDEVRDSFQFIRKGKVGNWREWFNEDTLKKWNSWIKESNTSDSSNNNGGEIPVKYEL